MPFEGDTAKLNRRAAEFETTYHDSVKRNLPTYLPLTMEIISELHKKTKNLPINDASKKMVRVPQSFQFRDASDNIDPRLHSFFQGARHTACEIAIASDVRGNATVPNVAGSVLVPCAAGR